MINTKTTFKLFLPLYIISLLLSWEPFHNKEQLKHANYTFDPLLIDRNIIINQDNQTRSLLSHTVVGYLPYWEYYQYPDLDYNLLTRINYFSAELNSNGDVINNHNWNSLLLVDYAHSLGVEVVLCATLFGSNELTELLSSESNRTNAINNLLTLVLNKNADGIDIDFELLPLSQRDNLVLFMEELSEAFHNLMVDPIITMATPAVDWSNAWDYQALANICDELFIMGYNYFYSGSTTAGPVAPLGEYFYDLEFTVNDYLTKTNNQTDKLILGLPYYGYEWPTIDNSIHSETTDYGSSITYSTAANISESHGYNYDNNSNAPWIPYLYNNNWWQAWYDDSLSLSIKYNYAKDNNLKGVGIWALGYDEGREDLWDCLEDQFLTQYNHDLNADNDVNILDVIYIIHIILETLPYDINADLNNDSVINIIDVMTLINIILTR